MTEEEIKALQDAQAAATAKIAEYEAAMTQLKADAEKAKEDLNKVVEELKDERQKKNEALSKVDLKEGVDVNALIEQALQAREAEVTKSAFEEAIQEFKNSKQEFQNDAAGLVFGRFQEGMKRFNFADIKTKDQIKNRLEEVYKFLNFKPNESESEEYAGTPSSNGAPSVTDNSISAQTKSILKDNKISEEQYKDLQTKFPEALAGLGIG